MSLKTEKKQDKHKMLEAKKWRRRRNLKRRHWQKMIRKREKKASPGEMSLKAEKEHDMQRKLETENLMNPSGMNLLRRSWKPLKRHRQSLKQRKWPKMIQLW